MIKDVSKIVSVLSLAGLLSVGLVPIAYAGTISSSSGTATNGQGSTSSGSDNQAQPAISETQAMSIATKLLGVPQSAGIPRVNTQLQGWFYHTGPMYNVSWSPIAQSRHPNQFYSAMIDATTGEVLSFNSSSSKGVDFTSNISQDNAEKAAKQWVAKLATSHAGEVVLDDAQLQPNGSGYQFSFVRMVNGIPAPFDSIQVGIDGNGHLSSYQLYWTDPQFPSAMPAISLSDAKADVEKNPPSQLQYTQTPQFRQQALAYMLTYTDNVYTPPYINIPGQEGLPWLDANTGQSLQANGAAQPTSTSPNLIPIVSGGTSEWPKKLSQPLDAIGAEQVARQNLNLSSDWQLQNSNQQTGPSQASTMWSLQFQNKSNQSLSVGVDANFGIVIQANNFNTQGQGVTSPDHLLAQSSLDGDAVSFVKSALPTLTAVVNLVPIVTPNGPQRDQGYQIFAKANGVSVDVGTLNLSQSDGQVDNYWLNMNWSATLPDPSKAISAEDAWRNLLAKEPLRLEYVLPTDGTSSIQGFPNLASTARLVYAPKTTGQTGVVDATTGNWMTYGAASPQQISDIKGHYGENEMNYLVTRGVLSVKDGKVNPNATVSRGQFISMLSQLNNVSYGGSDPVQVFQDVSKSSPYYNAVLQALYQGWLPVSAKLNPDAPVTRMQAAAWLVGWLGWQEIATKTSLYQISMSDSKSIPQSQLGDASIAVAFGLIPLKNKAFSPNGSMTVADVAVALAHGSVVNDNE